MIRLQLLLGADLDGNNIPELTFNALTAAMEKNAEVILTDSNPDVVHIIGGWDATTMKVAKDCRARFIAYVHTPLTSLSPWEKPTTAKVKLTSRATYIVASGDMEKELLDDGSRKNIMLIKNPVTTATTTREEMAILYKEVYEKALADNDVTLWEEVNRRIALIKESDDVILEICRKLLYANFLYRRGNIPQKFLSDLSALMTKSNYNEDRILEVLKLIKLLEFTQHLEFVMKEKASLTEGYMPIIWKEDKTSTDMLNLVTDY